MDLLAIFSSLRRHKLIALVILLLTVAGDAYVVFGVPPAYESQAQYVLISPPPLPSETQIERNPNLGRLNTNNPYLRLPNPSVVVDVLAQRISGDVVRRALVSQGADTNYQISATNAIGSGLVIQIVGTGHSAAQSLKTIDLVSVRMKAELHDMQTVDGADDRFLFQALAINPPTDPLRKVTSTVRSLIAVIAAGVILLFGSISVAEAIPTRRTKRVLASGADRDSLEDDTIGVDTDITMVLPRQMINESMGTRSKRRKV